MAKQKQRQLVPAPTRKKRRSVAQDADLHYENSWVVVKKQKVTILIPALPVTELLIVPPDSGKHAPPVSLRSKTNLELECTDKLYSQNHSVSEHDKSISPVPESVLPTAKAVHPLHSHLVPKLSKQRRPSVSSENPEINNVRVQHSMGTFKAIKMRKQALLIGDGQLTMNARMRASNIERKLQRAGGLNNWLISIGLQRFVKLFQQRNVNKFQLANLTMKKLKDMGAQAVGPRRKLMHAIDCLCQPYCFERL
ncbi:OLC1v1033965C1 [Oldenlandia corymbosa var. corymbosa]|uniref:OLC1v1033965C1 n=1 Tax=Oldenlandia corymbosa var. corymbosa TaxID=529605 RepID=A0AAV1CQR1_OLDCO|nr:OLC1v1033965C1 [Oldenlandia corymbosa var. corymbosa]